MFRFSNLRNYQLEDAKFLADRKRAGCFNEQRTGKTPTILAACALNNYKRIVVLCPKSAIYPWVDEFEYWTQQPCLACVGTPQQRKHIFEQATNGIIIGLDTIKITQNSNGNIEDVIKYKPDAIIIDEAHRINDRKTSTAKAVFALAKLNCAIYLLTGTPVRGKQEGIWSLLHVLNPKSWTSYWNFINEYFITVQKTNYKAACTFIDIVSMQPRKAIALQGYLNTISTMRKRKDVMAWLPEKDYRIIRLPVTKEQDKYLKELSQYYETETLIVKTVLERLIRYRQICLAPALVGLKGSSPKIDWIHNYISDYPDTPTIFFSKFTQFIHLITRDMKNVGVIVGATPVAIRKKIITDFQNKKLYQLFINIDAGKEALTLDTAEAIVFTDKYPPIADIEQAEDRFVSTIQERANKPHIIYELMMKDTYDETIFDMLKLRKSEADVINNYKEQIERRDNANRT